MQRHRHPEFIRFLNGIERTVPAGKLIHVILDNYAAHKHPKVLRWLGRHPRFVFHFKPTSCSWLNRSRPSSPSSRAPPQTGRVPFDRRPASRHQPLHRGPQCRAQALRLERRSRQPFAEDFADPRIGVVCATYRLLESGSVGEAIYWDYQVRVKENECLLSGTRLGAHGAFYMFRRDLFRPLPRMINDDFVLPMTTVMAGHRQSTTCEWWPSRRSARESRGLSASQAACGRQPAAGTALARTSAAPLQGNRVHLCFRQGTASDRAVLAGLELWWIARPGVLL